jgi:dihydrofolate reductase
VTNDQGAARPRLSLIVAVARNGVIGKDNRLPWRIPEDLKRFRTLTMGHHIIMGRRTWESIGRPLPGRTSVVITRDRAYLAPGATVVHSFADALAACAGDDEAFVIGGAAVYREALPLADCIYLTTIDADYEGDVFFPPVSAGQWREASQERHPASGPVQPAYDFVVLIRLSGTTTP